MVASVIDLMSRVRIESSSSHMYHVFYQVRVLASSGHICILSDKNR